MNPSAEFERSVADDIQRMGKDPALWPLTLSWVEATSPHRYTYHFSFLGRPLIQFPQDMVAIQELIWRTRPDLIIETGIAHGGSLVMSAAMLAMLDYCDAVAAGTPLDPKASRRRVLGVDIDIRPHNRAAIESHPLSHMINMIQGSAIDPDVVAQVARTAAGFQRVMVLLDSNHTHDHVLSELRAYAPLVTPGGYCVVFDTLIDDMPENMFADRPWGKGDNPKTAVTAFLEATSDFEVDTALETKLLITVAPGGYLRRRG